jgi:hypothetical protein
MNTNDVYKEIERNRLSLRRAQVLLAQVPAGQTHRRAGLQNEIRALLLEQAALSAKRDAGR